MRAEHRGERVARGGVARRRGFARRRDRSPRRPGARRVGKRLPMVRCRRRVSRRSLLLRAPDGRARGRAILSRPACVRRCASGDRMDSGDRSRAPYHEPAFVLCRSAPHAVALANLERPGEALFDDGAGLADTLGGGFADATLDRSLTVGGEEDLGIGGAARGGRAPVTSQNMNQAIPRNGLIRILASPHGRGPWPERTVRAAKAGGKSETGVAVHAL